MASSIAIPLVRRRLSLAAEVPAAPSWTLKSHWPLLMILVGCTLFQRFAVPVGSFQLPLSLILTVVPMAVLILQRKVVASRAGTFRYLLFTTSAACSVALALYAPVKGVVPSIFSFLYFAFLYAVATLRWSDAVHPFSAFAIYRALMVWISGFACIQFFLQFAGIQLFSFQGLIPEPFLLEHGFNIRNYVWYGSHILRATGLVLVEPSFLSQFSALALVIEYLYFGSLWRLGLFAAGLLLSFSGTGLLLLLFALVVGSLQSRASALGALKLFAVASTAVVLLMMLAPEYALLFVRRAQDFGSAESSSYLRFVGPLVLMGDHLGDPRLFLGYGPGAYEQLSDLGQYNASPNSVAKLTLEYGILGFSLYVPLVISVFYRRDFSILSLVGLLWVVIGGGYLMDPSVLFVLYALLTISAAHTKLPARPSLQLQ